MKRIYSICLLFVAFILSTNLMAQAPVIVEHPNSGTKCVGNQISFTVVASGSGTLHYQWYFEGNPVGIDSPTHTIVSVSTSDQGFYYCNVSNGSESANSNQAQLVVASGIPVINSFSDDQNLCQGEAMSLSVDATADFAAYRWYVEGNTEIVHLGQTYTETETDATLSGNYYCEVTNVCGMVSTELINVVITDLPVFISMPEGTQICEGNDVSFSVVAGGSNIQYKWLADGDEIIGETSSSLVIEDVLYPHDILYTPVIYNSCAELEGNEIGILVFANPAITGQPIEQGACGGDEITLYATAFSNTDLSYQWYFNGDILSGETTTSLEIQTEEGVIDEYYCLISNLCSTVSTDTIEIIGYEAPYITMQPHDSITCAGNDASFACKANGEEPLSYEWLFNGAIVPFGNVSGIDVNTLQFSSVFTGEQGAYTCFVYNECGSVLTDEAILTVNTPPSIIAQPEDASVCSGNEVDFEVLANGTEPITYEWIYLENGQTAGSSALLHISATEDFAGQYYCMLENQCGEATTNNVTLTVKIAPGVSVQPDDIMACDGDSIALIVDAYGTEPISYLWYRNNSAESWATNDTIIFNPVLFGNTGTYFCRLMNECGTTDSDPFLFHVGTPPTIEWHSGDQYLCENDTLRIEVDPAGENLFFEWTHNDEILIGANDSILEIPWINPLHAGEYICRIFNACSEIFTDTVNVTINPAPEVDLGQDIEACFGTPVSLHPQGEFQSYNWNNGEGTAPWFDVTESGSYFVRAMGDNGCYNYDTVEVVLHPVVAVNLGDDISICGPVELSGPEGAYSYLWSTGGNSAGLLISESGDYWLRTTGSDYGCEASDTIHIDIYEIPDINLGPDHTIAADSTISVGVDAVYDDYMWYNGFNGPILTITGSMLGLGTHTIWLRVYTENNCTDTDTVEITVQPAQSIGNLANADNCLVYPNPAREQFCISPNISGNGKCLISLVDLHGKVVSAYTKNYYDGVEWSFEASGLAPGLYYLELQFDTGTKITKKISIQ
ncbi:MAG TPA: immunoglobulin domain-containing protein [Bacteroidales bacterium]|mgnify:CR=1 FL=1|nr:immunoglobulin domain-containing protein [Bacteroidales bacterium]